MQSKKSCIQSVTKYTMLHFGRGKTFHYKYISEDKVLICKLGIEFLLDDEKFKSWFDICNR